MIKIEEIVSKKRNTLKTDRLDMSFGELINIYSDKELFISPEYQRAFRWSDYQRTRFIESVLLGIPIPPIFVAEDDNGKWEVVDGLQRISTIFSFFGVLEDLPKKNNFILTKGDIVEELEGLTADTIPLKLKNTMKRSVCRVEIVNWDSNEDIRYELFNRLNTGSSPLSEQEVRNCIFRAYKVNLNQALRDLAKLEELNNIIVPTAERKEQMFLEELVLRYFAFKHLEINEEIKITMPHFLTKYMKLVSEGKSNFDIEKEKELFSQLFKILFTKYGKSLFRLNGRFTLHLFDSISFALPKAFPVIDGKEEQIFDRIDALLCDEDYKSIGPKTFSTRRVKDRMNRALTVFMEV
jgi:hypothetical protein